MTGAPGNEDSSQHSSPRAPPVNTRFCPSGGVLLTTAPGQVPAPQTCAPTVQIPGGHCPAADGPTSPVLRCGAPCLGQESVPGWGTRVLLESATSGETSPSLKRYGLPSGNDPLSLGSSHGSQLLVSPSQNKAHIHPVSLRCPSSKRSSTSPARSMLAMKLKHVGLKVPETQEFLEHGVFQELATQLLPECLSLSTCPPRRTPIILDRGLPIPGHPHLKNRATRLKGSTQNWKQELSQMAKLHDFRGPWTPRQQALPRVVQCAACTAIRGHPSCGFCSPSSNHLR